MSVIIFGYIGGLLVDRKGSLYVLTIGIVLMSSSFLIAAFFIDAAPWLMTVIIVLFWGSPSQNGYIYNCVWQFETKGSRRRNESA